MNGTDQELAPRQAIPRPSRLPRALSSTVAESQQGVAKPASHVPKSVVGGALRLKSSGVLRQSSNAVKGSQFGWHQHSNDSQVRSSNSQAADDRRKLGDSIAASVVEGSQQPPIPSEDALSDTNSVNRNSSIASVDGAAGKKKPRPSLSERTIETLSNIPPSPSPSRRKSSISKNMAPPPPPPLIASRSKGSRPGTPSSTEVLSPTDTVQAPSTRTSTGTVRTLSKTPIKHVPKLGKPPSSGTRSISINTDSMPKGAATPRTPISAHKVKSMHDLRAAAAKQPARKVSLNFRDASAVPSAELRSPVHASRACVKETKPRSPRAADDAPTAHAATTTPSRLKKRSSFFTNRTPNVDSTSQDDGKQNAGPKSSSSLRETIAKAKAMKREAATRVNLPKVKNDVEILEEGLLNNGDGEGISKTSLKKRVANAITSGTLNVAALGLKQIPEDVLKMYDPQDAATVSWSEAVDLTKVILADNEIEDIPDHVFPDWTLEELMDDDEKMNIFGGLETLDLRGNQLTRLPIGLRRLSRLHTLNLSNNKVTSDVFDVICQISSLRDLNLANNNIEGVLPASLARLNQLRALDLHDNKLVELGTVLGDFTHLQKLNVSGNMLSVLPLQQIQTVDLVELNAAKNKLVGTLLQQSCTSLGRLQELNVSNNQLTLISSEALELPQLQSLVVDSNQLAVLPNMSMLENLTTLTASENRLEELPDDFVKMQSLRSANFSGNNIRNLDPYISRMESLTVLNIAGNPLRDRRFLSMSTPDLKSELAKRLTAVLVKDDAQTANHLDEPWDSASGMPAELDALFKPEKGILDLSSKGLASIEPSQVDLSCSIHTIRLAHNKLPTFPIDLLIHPSIQPNLKTLDVSHNITLHPTQYLPHPIYLPALQSLHISATGLSSIDPLTDNLSAPTLSDLNISNHRLTGFVPHFKLSFPNLTTLLATDNNFTSVTPDAIAGIEVVDIRNNEIDSLPPKIGELGNFTDQKQPGRLRVFEVSGNRFRVPRLGIVEKGTDAVLADLRRMVNADDIGEEWRD